MPTPPRRRPRRSSPTLPEPPFLDITRPLGPGTPVFPGDPPVEISLAADPRRGDPARVTRLTLGTHAGTHVDAPCHLAGLEGGVESIPLAALIGPAVVVQGPARGVRPSDVADLCDGGRPARRILFRGGSTVTPPAARALARAGVLLVGTDGLSIDPVDDPSLPAHAALLSAGVVLLESLDLTQAPPGRYDLIALPLLLPQCDGAPARVLLMPAGFLRKTKAGAAPRRRRPA